MGAVEITKHRPCYCSEMNTLFSPSESADPRLTRCLNTILNFDSSRVSQYEREGEIRSARREYWMWQINCTGISFDVTGTRSPSGECIS